MRTHVLKTVLAENILGIKFCLSVTFPNFCHGTQGTFVNHSPFASLPPGPGSDPRGALARVGVAGGEGALGSHRRLCFPLCSTERVFCHITQNYQAESQPVRPAWLPSLSCRAVAGSGPPAGPWQAPGSGRGAKAGSGPPAGPKWAQASGLWQARAILQGCGGIGARAGGPWRAQTLLQGRGGLRLRGYGGLGPSYRTVVGSGLRPGAVAGSGPPAGLWWAQAAGHGGLRLHDFQTFVGLCSPGAGCLPAPI